MVEIYIKINGFETFCRITEIDWFLRILPELSESIRTEGGFLEARKLITSISDHTRLSEIFAVFRHFKIKSYKQKFFDSARYTRRKF